METVATLQLAAYYAKVLEDNWDMSFVTNTLLPSVGVEVFGHGLRRTKHLLCHIARLMSSAFTFAR